MEGGLQVIGLHVILGQQVIRVQMVIGSEEDNPVKLEDKYDWITYSMGVCPTPGCAGVPWPVILALSRTVLSRALEDYKSGDQALQ